MTLYPSYGLEIPLPTKRKAFVSYHHGGDQAYYDYFAAKLADQYEVITDNSLERKIQSDNVDYVMRCIRENYVSGSSCTIVLCGVGTRGRKYVDWEISATLDKQHGLLGVKLPNNPVYNDNTCDKPDRLQDNLDTGYAIWTWWENIIDNPANLTSLIEQANAKPKNLINNRRPLRKQNA